MKYLMCLIEDGLISLKLLHKTPAIILKTKYTLKSNGYFCNTFIWILRVFFLCWLSLSNTYLHLLSCTYVLMYTWPTFLSVTYITCNILHWGQKYPLFCRLDTYCYNILVVYVIMYVYHVSYCDPMLLVVSNYFLKDKS